MTANGNKHKLKGSCLFHFDYSLLFTVVLYAGPTKDLQTQSQSAACFVSGSIEPEKMDSEWISGGFSACDRLCVQFHYTY